MMGGKFDLSKIKESIKINREKLIVFFVAGIFLIIISGGDKNNNKNKSDKFKAEYNTENEYKRLYEEKIEEKLKKLIECVDGIDKCEVMITLKEGSEKIVQVDSTYDEREEKGDDGFKEIQNSSNTLVLKNENSEYPYITKEIMPIVEGVVVVAKGANNTKEKNEIIDIVQALFDIEIHKITIAEMK